MKLLRKKLAYEVEDELFTIKHELKNLDIIKYDFDNKLKSFKKMDYSVLKDIRTRLQRLSVDIKRINEKFELIGGYKNALNAIIVVEPIESSDDETDEVKNKKMLMSYLDMIKFERELKNKQ